MLLLYRDELYDQDSPDKGVVEINVAKQRMGRRGIVYATWLGEHYAIADRADLYVPRLPTVARRKPSFVEADR